MKRKTQKLKKPQIAVPLEPGTYQFVLQEAKRERRTIASYVRLRLEDLEAAAAVIVEDSTPPSIS